jgi:hypothetical protein
MKLAGTRTIFGVDAPLRDCGFPFEEETITTTTSETTTTRPAEASRKTSDRRLFDICAS